MHGTEYLEKDIWYEMVDHNGDSCKARTLGVSLHRKVHNRIHLDGHYKVDTSG
ncbi:hypothetical protein LguiA_021648 [Lonicera macranthoides]